MINYIIRKSEIDENKKVIKATINNPDRDSTYYGRYLGFVWVDGVLLNLELVEQAYSNSTLSKSKYVDYFRLAENNAKITGRRFYGEIDPNYDYNKKVFK